MSEHREPSPAAPSSDEPTGAQAPNDDALRLPSARPLSPPVLRSRRRQALDRARRLPWVTLALALALAGKAAECESGERERDCRQTVKVASNAVAALVCQEEYERSADPEVGALLANARLRAVDLRGATAVATALLTTSAQADALQVLGRVANNEKRYDDAQRLFEHAAELHRVQERWSEHVSDLSSLAWTFTVRERTEEALATLQRGIVAARRAGDVGSEIKLLWAAVRALNDVGHSGAALTIAQQSIRLAQTPKELAMSHYELGNSYQESGEFHRATLHFETALESFVTVADTRAILSTHLELADCLIETGALAQASAHLRQAEFIDTTQILRPERLVLEGNLATKQGRLEQARDLLERALRETDPDEPTELTAITVNLARIAVQRGALDEAERWAATAISELTTAQERNHGATFRSLLLARYRAAHELRFLALARAGKAEEALSALDYWRQQSAFFDLVPSPRPIVGPELSGLSPELRELSDLTRALARHRGAPPARSDADGSPLLALIVAEGELWRLTRDASGATLSHLGDAKVFQRELFERLRATPRDLVLAAAAGALLVPPELAQRSQIPLRLLLDDELAATPLEAVRLGATPLVALRPLVRVQRTSDAGCVPPRPAPRALVLADARGDLPAARRESELVARQLGTTPLVGSQATLAALAGAANYDLLHLAVHGQAEERGGSLQLADGELTAVQLAARGDASSLVMLAACISGVAPIGRYSLATAYLAAGAQQVIGTLRPISDAGAAEVINRFYLQGGARDPVRALARVQAELAATDNPDWPYFAAFGRPTCASAR